MGSYGLYNVANVEVRKHIEISRNHQLSGSFRDASTSSQLIEDISNHQPQFRFTAMGVPHEEQFANKRTLFPVETLHVHILVPRVFSTIMFHQLHSTVNLFPPSSYHLAALFPGVSPFSYHFPPFSRHFPTMSWPVPGVFTMSCTLPPALLRSASLASMAWRVALLMANRSATERRRPPLVVLAVSPATALSAVLKACAAFLGRKRKEG